MCTSVRGTNRRSKLLSLRCSISFKGLHSWALPFVGKELLFLTFVACMSLKPVVWQLWEIKHFVTIASEDDAVVLNSPSCLFKKGECLEKLVAGCFHLSSVDQSLTHLMVAMTYFLRSRRIQDELKFSSRYK